MKPRLDVVVVDWHSGCLLRRCLESLAQALSDSYLLERVIVVDNTSGDQPAPDFSIANLPLEIRRSGKNRGFGAACNQGAEDSRADYLLFLNPDIQLSTSSIRTPIDFLERTENRTIGIVGIQLIDESGAVQKCCARFPTPGRMVGHSMGLDRLCPGLIAPHFMREWPHEQIRLVDQVMGAFFLVRREVFAALAGFDERFFLYYEDVDFCLRARQHGWQTVYFPGTRAVHVGGASTALVPDLRLFCSMRGRVQFARRHFGKAAFLTVFVATVLLEPLARMAHAIGQGSIRRCRHTIVAIGRLYIWALRGAT